MCMKSLWRETLLVAKQCATGGCSGNGGGCSGVDAAFDVM